MTIPNIINAGFQLHLQLGNTMMTIPRAMKYSVVVRISANNAQAKTNSMKSRQR